MARPYWSGQITISLVSFGVKLFVATEAKGEIHFHQISRATGERVKYQKVTASAAEAQQNAASAPPPPMSTKDAFKASLADENTDEADAPAIPSAPIVRQSDIVKGYEYQKGQYVTIEPSELANLRVPSKHTMEIAQFVDEADIDPEYYEKPYFCVPENESQTQAFTVVRQALADTKKVALSKIAFGGREHIVAITPAADGGVMCLHHALPGRTPRPQRLLPRHQAGRSGRGFARSRQAAHQEERPPNSTPNSLSTATKSPSKNSSRPRSTTPPSRRTSHVAARNAARSSPSWTPCASRSPRPPPKKPKRAANQPPRHPQRSPLLLKALHSSSPKNPEKPAKAAAKTAAKTPKRKSA